MKAQSILHVVGARPNFVKVAPVLRAFSQFEYIRQYLIHTGQHYDANMSDVYFQQLGIPDPDVNLGVGSGSHTVQTAQTMIKLETVLLERNPNLVLVYGDVNSTVAAALACAKLQIPIGHVEAGLRSGDRTMPEEINRVVTDQLSDLLFTPSADGNDNLAHEGIDLSKIHLVGNVMIDTLIRVLPHAEATDLPYAPPYALVTLHRPSNVDNPTMLASIMKTLIDDIAPLVPVLFPVHPRTRQRLADLRLEVPPNAPIQLLDPVSYVEFLALQQKAAVVITDSGGIQEETTFLGVPCLTVRENTERPVTVSLGTNILVGRDMAALSQAVEQILNGHQKHGQIPPLWDGKASQRIAEIIVQSV